VQVFRCHNNKIRWEGVRLPPYPSHLSEKNIDRGISDAFVEGLESLFEVPGPQP
jgi:hypothetical protein